MYRNYSFKVKSNISANQHGRSIRENVLQQLYNFIFFPLRCILPYKWLQKLNLTDLGRERRRVAIPYLRGKILDVGCGPLRALKNEYKNDKDIISIDIVKWGDIDALCSAENLMFKESTFDTVLMLACLNHICDKRAAIKEAYRVLRLNGRIVISMINPFIGYIVHKLDFWFDYDRDRNVQSNEEYGLTTNFVIQMLRENRFKNIKIIRFLYGLNKLFIGEK